MAEQFLSDFKTPQINANSASRVLSNEVLFMIYQGVIETEGQGITQRFSTDTSGAEIRIIVPQALNIGTRELGASLNGDNFASSTKQSQSTSVGLSVLQVIDTPIDIAQVTQDMIPISILETQMKVLGMEINTQLNALTLAGKIANTFPAIQNGVVDMHIIDEANMTGAQIRNVLITANSRLDEGDAEHNLAYFPNDDRIMVIKPSMRPLLMKEGVIVIGGSNYAQDIIKNGGVSVGAKRDYNRTAVIGEFDGMPVAIASPVIWAEANGFLGTAVYSLDNVLGYISSGYANVRAVAQQEQMKIIDSPQGVGIRLQPLVRMGFRSFYPKANQFFVTPDFDVDAFITEAGGVIASTDPNYAGDLLVRGKNSRTARSSVTTLSTVTFGGKASTKSGNVYTITGVTAGANTALVLTPTAGCKIEVLNQNIVAYGTTGVNKVISTATTQIPTFRVRVTAPDGTVATYVINVTYTA